MGVWQALESYWLGGSAFVAGDAVSIGDLPIASELEQLRMLAGATQVPRSSLAWLRPPPTLPVLQTRTAAMPALSWLATKGCTTATLCNPSTTVLMRDAR